MTPNLKGQSVLVAEDEYFIADEIAQQLESLGALVIGPVASVSEALSNIGDGGADFAVVDINLNGRADFAVADMLTECDIPFVFATGYDDGVIPERHREVARWGKPFDAGALARVVAKMAAA